MRHLHVDPFSGAAGDMLIGALLDVGLGIERLREGCEALKVGSFKLHSERVQRGALSAIRFRIEVEEAPTYHRDPATIARMIEDSRLSAGVKARALAAFRRLGEAEAAVHGIPLEKVHFHEVGAIDSILDIVGFCLGLEELGVTTLSCGHWRVGRGATTSEHGLIPVPPPATIKLATGFTLEDTGIGRELFTPTAAALLAALCTPASVAPPMVLEAAGYGAGTRDLKERPNVCRVLLGTLAAGAAPAPEAQESCVQLEANLDDQSPEEVAYALECMRAAGALDAWATPAVFKKGRLGVVVAALVTAATADAIRQVFLRETSTLGVRSRVVARQILAREVIKVTTAFGEVEVKLARDSHGHIVNIAPELESAAGIARATGTPLKTVMAAAREAAARI